MAMSGIYLILQALISFGCGGYIAGRTRAPIAGGDVEDLERRDGLHGVAAWALAVVLGVLLAAFISMAANRPTTLTAPTSTTEPTILSYEMITFFECAPAANLDTPARAEAGRILLTSSSHSGVSSDDRAYLVQLVTTTTGLAGPGR